MQRCKTIFNEKLREDISYMMLWMNVKCHLRMAEVSFECAKKFCNQVLLGVAGGCRETSKN